MAPYHLICAFRRELFILMLIMESRLFHSIVEPYRKVEKFYLHRSALRFAKNGKDIRTKFARSRFHRKKCFGNYILVKKRLKRHVLLYFGRKVALMNLIFL